jgi:hypothetical protein
MPASRELRALFAAGMPAVRAAAALRREYELSYGGFDMVVTLERPGGLVAVRVVLNRGGYGAVVTAVYGARHAAEFVPLDVPVDHRLNVGRIVRARTVGDELVLFAETRLDGGAQLDARVAQMAQMAVEYVLGKLHELGLARDGTLVVVHGPNVAAGCSSGCLMYGGSDVAVGTVRHEAFRFLPTHGEQLQTLLHGGAWAVERHQDTDGYAIDIGYESMRVVPGQRVVPSGRGLAACVEVDVYARGRRHQLSLVAVYDAARPGALRHNEQPGFVRANALRGDMAIVVQTAAVDMGLLRRVLRRLCYLGLTTHETHGDALVVLPGPQAERLHTLISDTDVRGLPYREMGLRLKRRRGD